MSETGFSQVPCGVEHFIYWPKVHEEVSAALALVEREDRVDVVGGTDALLPSFPLLSS